MKAIFLSDVTIKLEIVYGEDVKEEIAKNITLNRSYLKKTDILTGLYKDTDIIFSTWGMPSFTKEEIQEFLPNLKCIFYGAGTVQGFARPFLELGIKVFSGWGANGVPVAEFTVAQILLANKGYFLSALHMSRGELELSKKYSTGIVGNFNAEIGIIGAGMIGKLVINKLRDYRLNVKVFDPFLSDEDALRLGVKKVSLEELFATCNVVSNHLANNEETKGMLNYPLFASMVEGATFINTGRGAQVVEEDLCKVLKERKDLSALLDVTHPEPPKEGHPFYGLDNCFLSPHIAGSLGNEALRLGEYMRDEFLAYITSKETKFEVTLKMLETMA